MTKMVLRFTNDAAAASAEIQRLGGRIVHQLTQTAFVAELPDGVSLDRLAASTPQPTGSLDYASRLAVAAWIANSTEGAEAPRATDGLRWDTPGYQAPRERSGTPTPAEERPDGSVELSTGTPTSLYLVGSVAVGVVIVSRDHGPESLSDADRTQIIQEVQAGLGWLATAERRAQVSWVYDIRPITVTVPPGPYSGTSDAYERYEAGWRDAALASMGYAAGRAGYQKYVKDLRASRGTKWAYVAFFTKYPLNHFAYAIWEKVVMHVDNDGWGRDDLDRVFAHETCHIFGAADEYGTCSCGGAHGYLGAPNNNCVNCFPPGTQEDCLMNKNMLTMCRYSRKQIGWDPALFPREAWSGENPMGGSARTLAVGRNADGRLEVFYVGTDGALRHNWQTVANGGWSGEDALGGSAKSLAVGRNADGRLEVFYIGTNDAIHHTWQVAPNGSWSGEQPLSGQAKALAIARNADGRLEVFYIGRNDALCHVWQTVPNGAWSGEDGLGDSAKALTVGQNADGRLEVFYIGMDDAIYHMWQTVPNGGWSGPAALGGQAMELAVASNADGRLEVCYVGRDGALYHNWQVSPNGGWSGEHGLGATGNSLRMGRNADGRLEVFHIGPDDAVRHVWQTVANGGWSPETALAGRARELAVANNADGRLEVFWIGLGSDLYHNWQQA